MEFYFTARLIKSLGFEPELKENNENGIVENKQTLRSLKVLLNMDLNKISKNELIQPILNQKENISKFLKAQLKYIKNIFS